MLHPARLLVVAAVALVFAGAAGAADIVEHTTSYGAVPDPYSINFGQTYIFPNAPTPGDRFVDDYGFIIGGSSFSSISATFDLGTTLAIGSLSMRLLAGDPFVGVLPHTLTAAETTTRDGQTIVVSTGTAQVQWIAPYALAPGHYTLEVSGLVTGSFGGSYAGVINVAPVPDAAGSTMALAGLALLGLVAVRRRT